MASATVKIRNLAASHPRYPTGAAEPFPTLSVISKNTLKVYDAAMKYVLLAMFVLFTAQPLQADSCDMHANHDTSHNQNGSMQDTDMEDMGCCDHDPADTGDGCNTMPHCGACTAVAVAIYPSVTGITFFPDSPQPLYRGNESPGDFTSPPFRPPIA